MIRRGPLAWVAMVVGLAAAPAWADPCEAPLPSRQGEMFSGQVRYVGEGDSLCVGRTSNPTEWIEVRLADFDAPELRAAGGKRAKTMLRRIALRQNVVCHAQLGRHGRVVSYDRVIGLCQLGGVDLDTLLRRAGAIEGGNCEASA